MLLRVVAPMAGHTYDVDDVPDPVFARGLVGPGVAIRPLPGRQVAVAPVSGELVKLVPHAYVVTDSSGHAVLVHLGIDTVHMRGAGFELLAREGARVEAGDAVVSWDPTAVEAAGRDPMSAVVVLDCDPATVHHQPVDVTVQGGDLILEVDC